MTKQLTTEDIQKKVDAAPLNARDIIARRTANFVETTTLEVPEWGCTLEIAHISVKETTALAELPPMEKIKVLLSKSIVSPVFTEQDIDDLLAVETDEELMMRILTAINTFNKIGATPQEVTRPFPVSE